MNQTPEQKAMDELKDMQKQADKSKRLPLVGGVNNFPTDPDPEMILVGNGAIRIGDVAFLNSGAGMGKSVSMGQLAMAWSLGLPYFGIRPARPLRILHYIGEDDEATMGQIREGFLLHSIAITGQQLTAKHLEPLDEMLMTQFDRTAIGNFFLAAMKDEVEAFRPDMVFINPLLSFIGGDPVQEATPFLRGGIMPILATNKCAALIAHHTCKLNKDSWANMDPTYSGIGGSEMANIPRTILTLMPVRDGIVQLQASKRTTYGWRDADDNYMDHAFFRRTNNPTRPAWLPVPYSEVEALVESSKDSRRKGDMNDVLEILDRGDRLKSAVVEDIMRMRKCGESTAKARVKEALLADIGVREYDGEKPERGGSAPKWLTNQPHE
ncbi:MAG: AAA family ATPase [Oligoflexus sp.]